MRGLVTRYKRSPAIRETALSLLSSVAPKDWRGEVAALFHYVRDEVRYTRDISGIETLQTPEVTLDLQAGDCDDKSTLLAALLESVGHPTRFVAEGYRKPDAYSHVYVQTKLGASWLSLDPTVSRPIGWSPPRPTARMVAHN